MPPLPGRIAVVLAFTLGTWVFVDGAHRLITGDFVRINGQVGPWAGLVSWLGANPMQFGPVLVILGIFWVAAANLYLFQNSLPSWRLMLIGIALTSWYAGLASLIIVLQLMLLLLPQTRAALRPPRSARAGA